VEPKQARDLPLRYTCHLPRGTEPRADFDSPDSSRPVTRRAPVCSSRTLSHTVARHGRRDGLEVRMVSN
jgi:hypothetical protein